MGLTLGKVFEFCNCCKRKTKKKGKPGKTKRDRQTEPTQKITIDSNTNWEAMNERGSLTPSQIPDHMLTREIQSGTKRRPNNEFEYDKRVLKLQNYEMVDDTYLGKGGFGVVYKVKNTITGEILAAKVIELIKGEIPSDKRFQTFKNEIFVLRRSPHKNIIQLKDHFVCDNSMSFIIMELANGGNLEQKLRSNGGEFSENVAKKYFVQITNAVYYLHRRGISHSDIKLPNVLISIIDGKEVLKLTDFGCSRVVFKKTTGIILKHKAIGTITYMAPEQIAVYISKNLKRPDLVKFRFKEYQPLKADMWAMGVLLYRLVHYTKPFPIANKKDALELSKLLQSMKDGFKLKESIFKKLSKDCIEVLKGLMDFDRYQRFDIIVVMSTRWVMSSDQLDKQD